MFSCTHITCHLYVWQNDWDLLAIIKLINTTYFWGRAYTEGGGFGRHDRKDSRLGAAAASSVTVLGGKKNFL